VPDLDNMASTLVLSLGTFAYGVIAGLVFWRIAIKPHRLDTPSELSEEPSP
jgi:hypothetical protein